MKKALFSLFLVPTFVFAQIQATVQTAGLTPENPFYFLDQLSENFQRFFTLNPDSRARLEVTFAKERIAEIKIILEGKGINAKGLSVAEEHLKDNFARATAVLVKEKQSGKDTRDIAKELADDFKEARKDLKSTFEVEADALEVKIDELKTKLKEARRTGNTAQVDLLSKEIIALTLQHEMIEQHEDDNDENIEEEDDLLDEAMELKEEAAEKIREATEEKTEIMQEMKEDNVAASTVSFSTFNTLLIQANTAFTAGNYAEAKRFAKEAEKSLDLVEKDIDKIKDSEEEREEEKEEEREEEEEEGAGEIRVRVESSVFQEERNNN